MFDIKQLLINIEDRFPDCSISMSKEQEGRIYQFNLKSAKFEVSIDILQVQIHQAKNLIELTELVCSELKSVADIYLQ